MNEWDRKFIALNSAPAVKTKRSSPGEERTLVLPESPDLSEWDKKFIELNKPELLTEEQRQQIAGAKERPKLQRFLDPIHISGKIGATVEGILEKKPGQTLRSSIFEQGKAGADIGTIVRNRIIPLDPETKIPVPGRYMGVPFVSPMKAKIPQTATTLAGEIASDPTTYVTGGLTKTGKAAELLTPKVTRIMEPLAEQATRGERALVQFGGKSVLPKSVNVVAYKGLDALRTSYREGKVFKYAGRYFHSPTGHPVTDVLAMQARDTQNYLENEYLGRYVKAKRDFTKAARKAGMSEEQFNAEVIERLERKKVVEKKLPGVTVRYEKAKQEKLVEEAANKLRAINDEVFKVERESGLWTNELQGDIDYWARIVTPEGQEFLKKAEKFPGAKEWKPAHANQLERKFSKDMTLDQANAHMKELMQKAGIEGDFFITDPFVTGSIRAARAAKAIKSRQFIDATTDFFVKNGDAELISGSNAKRVREIAESAMFGGDKSKGLYIDKRDLRRGLDLLTKSDDSQLKAGAEALQTILDSATEGSMVSLANIGEQQPQASKALEYLAKNQHNIYVLPEEVATELNRVRDKMFTGNVPFDMMLKGHDAATNWLRRWSLGIFPSYHARNIMGNVSNNWLAGITDPKWYSDAMRLQYLGRQGFGDLEKLAKPDADILDAMRQRGVINQGWYGADVQKSVEKRVKKPSVLDSALPGEDNILMKTGEAAGKYFENNARMAHFLAKVDEGVAAAKTSKRELTPDLLNTIYDNAAFSAKKYLFDYQDLTSFEKAALKRSTFFYTWYKKNAALQFEQILKQPGKYASIEKVRRNIEGVDQEPMQPDKYLAKWVKDNYPVRVRRDPDGTEYFAMLGGWLPMAQIFQFIHPEELMQGDVLGNIKETGRDIASLGAPIQKEMIQQLANYDFFWESAIDKGTEGSPEYSKYLGIDMPIRVKHTLRGLRLLNEIDKMFFMTGEGTPTPEDRATNFLAGFKMYPQDPVRGMEYYQRELDKKIQTIDYLARKYGRQTEQGRRTPEEYQNRIEALLEEREKWMEEGQQLSEDQRKFRESAYFEDRLRNRK